MKNRGSAQSKLMGEEFTMIIGVGPFPCCTCKAELRRGDIIRMRPKKLENFEVGQPQCASCAKREPLPIIDEVW